MKISDLKANQKNVTVHGTLKEISPSREFRRMGRPGKVANSLIEDDSGKVTLSLWNEEVDMFKAGDKVHIENGFVNEWQGSLQLSSGRFGKI